MKPTGETLLRIYRVMATARACDEKVYSLLKSGQFAFANWLSPRGQEVLGAAAVALQTDDYLVTYYRGLPEQLAKGIPLKDMWAEWSGKGTGASKGKGGAVHIVDPDCGVMLNSGIIGAGLPIANGLALSSRLRSDGKVTLCTFGDGASNQGAFHEALNLASVWKLPVVFLCNNNRYAETTAYAKVTAVGHVSDRSVSYSMPGVLVDGNDPVAVYDAASTAIELARSGGGPTLLEAMTYRFKGHYYLDEMDYAPPEEVAAARAADPVPVYRSWLIEFGHASEDDLSSIDGDALAEIEAAQAYAASSPDPELGELERDVWEVSA